jgi:hypothetical protein
VLKRRAFTSESVFSLPWCAFSTPTAPRICKGQTRHARRVRVHAHSAISITHLKRCTLVESALRIHVIVQDDCACDGAVTQHRHLLGEVGPEEVSYQKSLDKRATYFLVTTIAWQELHMRDRNLETPSFPAPPSSCRPP